MNSKAILRPGDLTELQLSLHRSRRELDAILGILAGGRSLNRVRERIREAALTARSDVDHSLRVLDIPHRTAGDVLDAAGGADADADADVDVGAEADASESTGRREGVHSSGRA